MSRAAAHLALAYAAFAALSTGVNLGVQWIVMQLAAGVLPPRSKLAVLAALVCGTGAGLVFKYVLDKRFIFQDASTGAATHARKFGLYAAMGLVTTGIFWGSELLFAWLSPERSALYVGGGIGLLVGYVIKYRLDRRFVFSAPAL